MRESNFGILHPSKGNRKVIYCFFDLVYMKTKLSITVLVIGAICILPILGAGEFAGSHPLGPGWSQQTSGTNRNLFGVEFVNETYGIAIGDRGPNPPATVRITSDGGATWNAATAPPSFSLYGLFVYNKTIVWASGSGGGIARSNDGGSTWVNSRNPGNFNENLRDIFFYNETHGWASGGVQQNGFTLILATTDGGATWVPQLQANNQFINAIDFVDEDHGWAVGLAFGGGNPGRIYNTSDGGITWTPINTGNQPAFNDVDFIDRWTGYVVGNGGTFLSTHDGGVTWQATRIVNNIDFNAVHFVSIDQGWAVGNNGNIYVTYDGGVTWTKQTSPSNSNLHDVYFLDAMRGWCAGDNGVILNTTDGGGLPTDKVAPAVKIMEPADGSTVNQTLTISVNATDNVGVTKVAIAIDGVVVSNLTSAPYNLSWDTLTVPDGAHVINATGYDSAGNKGYDQISVIVKNHLPDKTPPIVNITYPAENSKVSGEIIITVDARDDVSVANVSVRIDATPIGFDNTPPYEFPWNTTLISDGVHTINATAVDTSNNTGYDEIFVLVLNTPDNPPTVEFVYPKDGDAVSGTITLEANATDDKGITYVEFFQDGKSIGKSSTPPYQIPWDTTTVKNGSHILNVTAYDTVGQNASAEIVVYVYNVIVPDRTPPQVAITYPSDGASVSGVVTIKAVAVDNVAVSKVDFYIDSSVKGTDTSVPYELTWDTTKETNGKHTIMVTAYDTSSNKASASIKVAVAQGVDAPPRIMFLAPQNGSTVAKSVTVAVDARDDIGIKYVSIIINGTEVANLTSEPFTFLWDTTKVSDGNITLSATVVDTSSQKDTDTIQVIVGNGPSSKKSEEVTSEGVPLWVALVLVFLVVLLILLLLMTYRKKGPEPEEEKPEPLPEKDEKKSGETEKVSEPEKESAPKEKSEEPHSQEGSTEKKEDIIIPGE